MKRILATVALVGVLAACSTVTEDSQRSNDAPETEGSTDRSVDESETTEPDPTDGDSTDSEPPATETTEPEEPKQDEPTVDISQFTTDATMSENYPDLLGHYLPMKARVGGHEGYDRVVIEYDDGEGELTWAASYEDTPIEDGTGFAVEMDGERFLTLSIAGVRYPKEGELTSDSRIEPTGLNQSTIIEDVHVDYPFEGMHMAFIGVDEDRPYRVQVFDNPARVVVDIRNDS